MPKVCIAIRHVLFENFGVFENPIRESGFDIEYFDVPIDDLDGNRYEITSRFMLLD